MSEPTETTRKKGAIEVFMGGAKKGLYIGFDQILPAMILGYVIVEFLKLTGIIDILGVIFGPVMGIFGLPGESVVVLLSAFFAKAAGAATAANLFSEGIINAAQATILLMPSMLMGTLVGHYARIVLVSDANPKYRGLLLAVPIIDSVVGMLLMRLILTFMGLM
ncbi:MAG: nucleoside recognition protein [Firmicutes bacterium]|nr:nucleoside recognition protein [Bacillota bacterium]